MGVRGLETFVESNPKCCYPVKISKLVEEYRFKKKECIIVIDGMSILKYLYGKLSWLNGGSYKEYKYLVEKFVQKFNDIGVQLVIFFDGVVEKKKFNVWTKRREDDKREVNRIFSYLAKNMSCGEIAKTEDPILPENLSWLTITIFRNLGKQVALTTRESDVDIAQYAESNDCFGILGQDSDFIIFRGGKYYFSMKHFNLETMSTKVYDRNVLAHSLGLWPNHLPLLATLAGNDIIPRNDLKVFHNSLNKKGSLFKGVANFIKANNNRIDDLKWIAQVALGSQENETIIEESIRSYYPCKMKADPPPKINGWDEIISVAEQFHVSCFNYSPIYTIIATRTYRSGIILENYEKPIFPLYGKLLWPLRKKLYGILLNEKVLDKNEKLFVKEYIVGAQFVSEHLVEPIFPKKHHPGLKFLWGNSTQKDYGWGLLLEALNLPRPPSNIPTSLILFTLALAYLNDLKVGIEEWELDVLIGVSILVNNVYTREKLAALPTDPISPRSVNLFALANRIYTNICIVNCACGFPIANENTSSYNHMDGKLFHFKYNEVSMHGSKKVTSSHATLCENLAAELDLLQIMHSYIFCHKI